jgi:hypothetical protein
MGKSPDARLTVVSAAEARAEFHQCSATSRHDKRSASLTCRRGSRLKVVFPSPLHLDGSPSARPARNGACPHHIVVPGEVLPFASTRRSLADRAARRMPVEAMYGSIKIRGARENNLKNVSLDIPKRKITVFTDNRSTIRTRLLGRAPSCRCRRLAKRNRVRGARLHGRKRQPAAAAGFQRRAAAVGRYASRLRRGVVILLAVIDCAPVCDPALDLATRQRAFPRRRSTRATARSA